MKASVVICTHNRSDILADTIDSFLQLHQYPGCDTEVLIVDNKSTDSTAEIAKRYAAHWPSRVRYVFESVQGLSTARNTGIRETDGSEFIMFADDDVFFDKDWLIATIGTFVDNPDAMCVGGRSLPTFPTGILPTWIGDRVRAAYGSTNSGSLPKQMHYPEHPFGLNMAFRRMALSQVGPFDTNLGRKGKNLLSCEESDYFMRVSQQGLVVRYTPDALVYHRISEARIRRWWVIKRYYWQGISDVIFKQKTEQLGIAELRRRSWFIFKMTAPLARSLLRRMLRGRFLDAQGMDLMAQISWNLGAARQLYIESRS